MAVTGLMLVSLGAATRDPVTVTVSSVAGVDASSAA
jgi:hypothetical protein